MPGIAASYGTSFKFKIYNKRPFMSGILKFHQIFTVWYVYMPNVTVCYGWLSDLIVFLGIFIHYYTFEMI